MSLIDLVFIHNFIYFEIQFSRATASGFWKAYEIWLKNYPCHHRNNSASFDRNTADSLKVGLFPIKPRDKPASLRALHYIPSL
jgi:hypothetical protein